jgi:hypothetical protein
MPQNRSFDPPILTPPDRPPRTIIQIDVESPTSCWGNIPSMRPGSIPEGGVPLQTAITGKSNTDGGRR